MKCNSGVKRQIVWAETRRIKTDESGTRCSLSCPCMLQAGYCTANYNNGLVQLRSTLTGWKRTNFCISQEAKP